MIRILEQLLKWGNTNPRKLFLFDGLGAIVSAILLGIVLVKLEKIFGIPKSTLWFLGSLPCLFAIYDFYCFYKINDELGVFLKGIAGVNLLFCCISIGLAIYHHEVITLFGWAYILLEILIVVLLAIFELSVSKTLIRRTK